MSLRSIGSSPIQCNRCTLAPNSFQLLATKIRRLDLIRALKPAFKRSANSHANAGKERIGSSSFAHRIRQLPNKSRNRQGRPSVEGAIDELSRRSKRLWRALGIMDWNRASSCSKRTSSVTCECLPEMPQKPTSFIPRVLQRCHSVFAQASGSDEE